MRLRFACLSALFLLIRPGLIHSGPAPGPADPLSARAKMDSLREDFERKFFPSAETDSWRACQRDKGKFLAEARKSDPAFAAVDTLIRRAKLARAAPEDPGVLALMERKYLLEQGLENGWNASAEGKNCLGIEAARRRRLDSALDAHSEYRKWKKTAESDETPANPI